MSFSDLVEYARYFGLTIDHNASFEEVLTNNLERLTLEATSMTTETFPEVDTLNLPAPGFAGNNTIVEEKPSLTSEQSRILLSAISQPQIDLGLGDCKAWKNHLPNHKWFRQLKLEEPLLIAGNGVTQTDIRLARKGANTDALLHDWQERWEEESQALSKRQSLESKAWLHDMAIAAADLETKTKKEKIEVSKGCMMRLHNTLKADTSSELMDSAIQQDLTSTCGGCTKTSNLILCVEDYAESEHLMPAGDDIDLLSPLPSDTETGKPETKASLATVLDLQTPGDDSIEAYLLGIGNRPNKLTNMEILTVRPNSSRKRKAIHEDAPSKRRKVVTNRHLEDPTSTLDLQPPLSGVAAIAEQQVSPQNSAPRRPDLATKSKQRPDGGLSASQESDSSLDAELVQLSVHVESHVDQNSSSYVKDRRTSVAKLEIASPPRFASAKAVDTKQHADLGEILDHQLNRIHLSDWKHDMTTWPALPVLEYDDILTEELNPDCSGKIDLLVRPPDIVTSDKLLWKPPGLRLLNDSDDDNEEIDIADTDDESLVQSNGVGSVESEVTNLIENGNVSGSAKSVPLEAESQVDSSKKSVETINTLPNEATPVRVIPRFSAAASLSAFLDLRGKRFKRPPVRSGEVHLEPLNDPIQSTQKSDKILSSKCNERTLSIEGSGERLERKPIALPLPSDSPLGWPKMVILNTDVLQTHASLARFLDSHNEPSMTIVYRDFTMADGVVPDIILGPTSCMIITSVQALTQQSLPGHRSSKSASLIREKIIQLSRKYEFVAVLTTCLLASGAGVPMVTPVAALCSSLSHASSHKVQTIYVLHETSEELKKGLNAWTWALVLEHAFPSLYVKRRHARLTAVSMNHDESSAETFLRRIGMNAMSARIVLTMLDLICVNTSGWEQDKELGYFKQMSSSRRLTLFGDIVGSEAIKLVNSVLENEMQ